MSHCLLIYIDENTNFNRQEIIQAISSIEHTYDISLTEEKSEDEDTFKYALFCYYDFKEEEVSVRVDKDLKSIFVKDFSEAALNFAFDLQQIIDVGLSATDSDYSFLCQIDQITSIEEFKNVVSQRIYMNE